MFRVEDIRGYDDHMIAYKVVEKKYIDNLVNQGQIYFGLLEDYRKMEQENKCQIGDCHEAALTNYICEYVEIDGQYVEIHGPNAGNNIRINANQCAFCFYMVGLKSYIKGADEKYRFCISGTDLEKICIDKGGIENCAIIIFDCDVIEKIYNELKNRKLLFRSHKIIYDDFNYVPKCNINTELFQLECCFHKQKKYAYQNEYRIAALNNKKKPIDDLFIKVEENDFQVVELKDGHDFCCCVEVNAHKISEKEVLVNFCFEHSLRAVKTNETEI